MSFLKGNWNVIKEKKELEAKYGDNAVVLMRAEKAPQTPKGHKHSFNHLLNKNHKVVPWQQKLKEVS